MAITFKGGIHVKEYKNTAHTHITAITPPKTVKIPLSQHIGAPCTPCVKVGERVLRGQKIGDVSSGLGCPVHSSISGNVKEITYHIAPNGARIEDVIIENDFQNELHPSISPSDRELSSTTADEIIGIVRDAGISGMGGATFPTYAKIKSAIGKVDTLIINGAECEPFITANNRLINERPEQVIEGTRILLHVFGLSEALIAIEDNKPHSIQIMTEMTEGDTSINVRPVKTKYPQGDERQLIYALTGRQLPTGKLPADVGCVVFNVETVASIYRAFYLGLPLIERIVTVDGDCIKEPKNLLVPIGTSLKALIEECGGLTRTPKYLINGGPMMGHAMWDFENGVTKGTSAILALSEQFTPTYDQPHECIRCGRCVSACPMHLTPNYLAAYARRGLYDTADELNVRSCVECGACSYMCPAYIPIVQYIRVAKAALNAKGVKR